MSPSKLKLLAWEEPPVPGFGQLFAGHQKKKLAPAYPPDRALLKFVPQMGSSNALNQN